MSAFDEIFIRYHTHIYGYLLGLVGDIEQAQDLTQDTFLKAYKALPRTPDRAPPIWLYRLATDAALDALHCRRRSAPFPFAPITDAQWVAVEAGMAPAWAEHAALTRLTPRQRACLLLRARDGFSIAEIAHILGVSTGAVKVALRRVKEQCRIEAPSAPVRQALR